MTGLMTAGVRVLDDRDAGAAQEVLDADPVGNVFVAARIRTAGFEYARLGAQVWGYSGSGPIESLCYWGANLIPVSATPAAAAAFAAQAARQGRVCSSILGRHEAVEIIWDGVRAAWTPARDVRPAQPLLITSAMPAVAADPAVRRVQLSELDALMPACVAMYTEEVGVSPVGPDGGAAYRSRVTEMVVCGHSYARIEDGEVLFKAEIGAVTPQICQVQGVWVTPRLRGRGLGTAGIAAVVADALGTVAPAVSLYVNAHNLAARRAYERVGFTSAGTFMSVLF